MATYTVDDQYLATMGLTFFKKALTDFQSYELSYLSEQESIHGKGKPTIKGGAKFIIPFEDADHSEVTQLTNGFEPLNLTVRAIGKNGEDEWCDAIKPVVIAGHEKRINQGPDVVIDILKARVENTLRSFMRDVHKRIWGLSPSRLTDLNTLNGDDHGDGFIEAKAAGTQDNTVHGISKSLYNGLLGTQNCFADGSGSFASNGLTGLDSINIRAKSIKGPGQKRRLYGSVSAVTNLKRAVRTQEQYVDAKMLDTGVLVLQYDGQKVLINRDMPDAGLETAAAPWSFALIDHEFVKLVTQSGEYFRLGEMKELSGYDVSMAPMHFMAQLVIEYFATSGILIDANAW